MGQQQVNQQSSPDKIRMFMKSLIKDIHALEEMLKKEMFEKDISRIGAEQEFFLVDEHMDPAPLAMTLLESMNDPCFTNELALFNLEANLDPHEFTKDAISKTEQQLQELYKKLLKHIAAENGEVITTGILPTIRYRDLTLDNLTPQPRYFALNDTLGQQRGEDCKLYIRGQDELSFSHDNVLIEACNTSFQVHFQVSQQDFAHYYNISQAITAPLLAIAANSPLLLGKRLWHETRIALFQQAIDTRQSNLNLRESEPRVWFGSQWVKSSVLELFQEDISKFKVLISNDIETDSMAQLKQGQVPKLDALCMHNGTVYRWNRPCYGVQNNVPHLRIENRVLPSGPTIVDAIANMAFFLGLMNGYGSRLDDVTKIMDFSAAKKNFDNVSMRSLNTDIVWFNGEVIPCAELIERELIPVAREGLALANIDQTDIDKYIGIIEQRVAKRTNGSIWMLRNFEKIHENGYNHKISSKLLVQVMHNRQATGKPLHLWDDVTQDEMSALKETYKSVEQVMSTNIFSVRGDDLIDLAAKIMHWNNVRHLPVESDSGELIGVLSYRQILDIYGRYASSGDVHLVPVKEVMNAKPITITPRGSIGEAIKLMRENLISALPVVDNGHLMGMMTEAELFKEYSSLLDGLH
ncbi:CBS domain-containing protein [Shewanella woodyi]|uniref:CBS domain-containing protein n=1 Tax=Shewanella woodyi TaxID=60961 RepID=UPI0007EBEAAE|nr:CBS domain-containing protein [Shewanella woodyi]